MYTGTLIELFKENTVNHIISFLCPLSLLVVFNRLCFFLKNKI
jgi:hypothetical protein